MAERITKTMFDPCLGTTFTIRAFNAEQAEQKLEVKLVETTELKPSSTNPKHELRQDPFSMIFEGPKETLLEQGTYKFEHEQLGELDMFLVPVGPGEYEVIFN